jgi:SSS family solute:Na+ symporter
VASVMGVWILFNPAEAGVAFGGVSAVLGYAVGEALPMLAYAKLGPRIRELVPAGHSLTEYALARYGPATYAFVLLVSLFYMFIFLAAELTAITNAYALVGGVPRWQTALLVTGAVLAYTTYGGLRASIATDAVQAAVVVPLVLVALGAAVVALGGPGPALGAVAATNPSLLDPTFLGGLEFGVYVSVAVLGAELCNQVWWQRVYAAADPADLPRAFGAAAGLNFVLVLAAGLLGVLAAGQATFGGEGPPAATAAFVLLGDVLPAWAVLGVALLALVLAASSADSLFNGVASLVTADLPRLLEDPSDRTLRVGARLLTVAVAVAAVAVALRARSVLRLFLLADLLGAALAVPLLHGLYSRQATGLSALAGGLAGVAVGVVFFPNPLVRGVLTAVFGGLLPAPRFLYAFLGAAGTSSTVAFAVAAATGPTFDLGDLPGAVRSLSGTGRERASGDD